MDLSAAQFGYFVTQVALSAASFGVAESDITAVGKALTGAFGYKDSMPAVVAPNQPAALQAICAGDGCPTAMNATTAGYSSVAQVGFPTPIPLSYRFGRRIVLRTQEL
jgi:hypothetical protein